MSAFACPHCGGEIVVLPGTSPFPGWESGANRGANPAANPVQGEVRGEIARKTLTSSSSPRAKTYNKGYDVPFLQFWEVYPRKRNKRTALLAYRRAILRANASVILEGARRYREDPNRLDEFTQHPATWLNGDGWEDEPLPARIRPSVRSDPPRPMTSGEIARAIEEEIERGSDG